MTTTPLTPKGLNSWKEVSTMVALQAFAAQTRISLTTSALFSDSGLQPCSSTNRCFPSACNDLPPSQNCYSMSTSPGAFVQMPYIAFWQNCKKKIEVGC